MHGLNTHVIDFRDPNFHLLEDISHRFHLQLFTMALKVFCAYSSFYGLTALTPVA